MVEDAFAWPGHWLQQSVGPRSVLCWIAGRVTSTDQSQSGADACPFVSRGEVVVGRSCSFHIKLERCFRRSLFAVAKSNFDEEI
jgi:hypothetical protein